MCVCVCVCVCVLRNCTELTCLDCKDLITDSNSAVLSLPVIVSYIWVLCGTTSLWDLRGGCVGTGYGFITSVGEPPDGK